MAKSHELNQQEQRLIFALVSIMEPIDAPTQLFRFSEKELAQALGIQENVQGNLYLILKGLIKKRVEISSTDYTLDVNWLISMEFIEQEGTRIIELEISTKLRPCLLELKRKTIQ